MVCGTRGAVQYTSTGFVARNRDTLQEDLQQALACTGENGGQDDGRRNDLIRQVHPHTSLDVSFIWVFYLPASVSSSTLS